MLSNNQIQTASSRKAHLAVCKPIKLASPVDVAGLIRVQLLDLGHNAWVDEPKILWAGYGSLWWWWQILPCSPPAVQQTLLANKQCKKQVAGKSSCLGGYTMKLPMHHQSTVPKFCTDYCDIAFTTAAHLMDYSSLQICTSIPNGKHTDLQSSTGPIERANVQYSLAST